jgi:hypothetical protein
MERRHMKHSLPFPARLEKEAKELIASARDMRGGAARDKILMKARQLKTAIDMNDWLSSPGLRAPK